MKKSLFILALATLFVSIASKAWADIPEVPPEALPVVALSIGGTLIWIRSRIK